MESLPEPRAVSTAAGRCGPSFGIPVAGGTAPADAGPGMEAAS